MLNICYLGCILMLCAEGIIQIYVMLILEKKRMTSVLSSFKYFETFQSNANKMMSNHKIMNYCLNLALMMLLMFTMVTSKRWRLQPICSSKLADRY